MAPFPITSLHPTIRKGGMSPPSSSSNYKLGSRWKEAGPENSPLPYFSYPSTKTRRNAVPLKSAPVKGAARTIISSSGVEREEATGCEKKRKEGRKEGREKGKKSTLSSANAISCMYNKIIKDRFLEAWRKNRGEKMRKVSSYWIRGFRGVCKKKMIKVGKRNITLIRMNLLNVLSFRNWTGCK